jgi:hypothetical protein
MPPDAATLRAPVDDLTGLHARIEALTVRAGAGEGDAAFVKRLEDLLAEGYREALRLDGERRQLDERMEALDRHAAELRSGLRMLRERFVALGGTRLDAA